MSVDAISPDKRRAVTAMIVDDSAFFRRRLKAMFQADGRIEVVAEAENGAEAVALAATRRPAVIVMDVNMPVMDGIEAVRAITARHPIPTLMFSSLTHAGARASLDALAAGALDFMPKTHGGHAGPAGDLPRALCDRLVALAGRRAAISVPSAPGAAGRVPAGTRLVVIGASTGGPVALQTLIGGLPSPYPVPIVVAQHMPERFTAEFAARLDAVCPVSVRESAEGLALLPDTVTICRGGVQTEIVPGATHARLRIRPSAADEIYQPSVDALFESAAALPERTTLAVVLTGMGADGTGGARRLKARGAAVWAQDEASSVVYGMPQAVARAELADRVLPLADIAAGLAQYRGMG